jgi:hypothetical protein
MHVRILPTHPGIGDLPFVKSAARMGPLALQAIEQSLGFIQPVAA